MEKQLSAFSSTSIGTEQSVKSGYNALCGHEEGLNDAVHVARVPQVDQASLAGLRLHNLPQKA